MPFSKRRIERVRRACKLKRRQKDFGVKRRCRRDERQQREREGGGAAESTT